jgi:biopolymer transport protein ExbD
MNGMSLTRRQQLPSQAVDIPELDVTPVMNMFVILIPFLVSMAVFTHVSIIELTLPPNVGAGLDASQGKPAVKLTVIVAPDYLAITSGEQMLDSLPADDEGYPFDGLSKRLRARREQATEKEEMIIAVRDRIAFKHVVRVMDRGRSAGFTRLALSSATHDPAAPEKQP